MSKYPTLSEEQRNKLRQQISSGDVEPFQELTVRLLESAPSPAAVQKFANRAPHLWLSAVTQAAKLTGAYERDSPKVNLNIYAAISDMSDAEIITHLERWFGQAGLPIPSARDILELGRTIDVDPQEGD